MNITLCEEFCLTFLYNYSTIDNDRSKFNFNKKYLYTSPMCLNRNFHNAGRPENSNPNKV